MIAANPLRGDTQVMVDGAHVTLRPSFGALVAAEAELGSLLALVDRAGDARVTLTEIAALFWHCQQPPGAVARDAMGAAIVDGGLAAALVPLRALLDAVVLGA